MGEVQDFVAIGAKKNIFRVMKIKKILLLAVLPLIALAGCTSPKIEDSSPREVVGIFKYTGATYSPIHINAPYRYALYDINGGFIAYLDTTKIVMASTNPFINNVVIARGSIVREDGDPVMRAENVRLKR